MSYIQECANVLIERYDTRDPFEIAEKSGIKIYYSDNFKELKGMYRPILQNRCIFLNALLDEKSARTVCAHELGHDVLHQDLARIAAFSDTTVLNLKTKPEYEANVFAAALLIDEVELTNLAKEGQTLQALAEEFCCDEKLVLIRMHELNKKAQLKQVEPLFNISHIPSGAFLRD